FPAVNGQPEKWLGGTDIEIPKSGLSWFINAIEQKFMKTEAEGGLKREVFTYSTVIDGEKLVVKRQFGVPGYGLMNFNRKEYVFNESPQLAEFTDQMLFENGLLDELKLVAKKIDNGEL
ncbi:hypothetical protein, partial [Agarivorans gilvus]